MAGALHLAVALDGAGWHPEAWRAPTARPSELTRPAYWRDLIRTADDAGLTFATIEDRLDLPESGVRGRLDALLTASYLAPLTRRIGLIPTVTTTHPEPFHLATGIQTLDHASLGRAGVRIVAASTPAERANFGRRESGPDGLPATGRVEDDAELLGAFRDAGDVVEALRRLWDSWEDDAIIRDVERARFLDRARVHGIRFRTPAFSIEGASITPRSPQGQPIVTALAHQSVAHRFAAAHADVVFVTPANVAAVPEVLAQIRQAEGELRRIPDPLRVFADLVVLVSDVDARAELDRLDAHGRLVSDARIVAGTPGEVAAEIADLAAAGVDGVRLRPARLPVDLERVASDVVPLLRDGGVLATLPGATLRDHLGLDRPASRYARPVERSIA